MKYNLTIIIVHWNTPDNLKILLDLLKKSSDYQIIVVDNASSQKLNWLKKDYPFVELLENEFNRGYAFACNQGATKVVGLARRSFNEGGEWLLFLNPDVEINPSQINKLLNHAKKNNLDVCSVKTNYSYQKPLPSLPSLFIEFTPINHLIGVDSFPTKTLFGGCLLIKTETLKSIGGWDERFFLWFEDSDLTYRLLKNNFKIGWLDLHIKHSGGESFKNLDNQIKKDVFFQGMDIYAKKHFSSFGKFVVSLLKKRFTSKKLLPELQNITSITIPNLKENLLTSFFTSNEKFLDSSSGVEWIIVASSIKSSAIWRWRKKYPQVRFIPIEKNYGFASTVNIGFRASSGRWLGTINDDVILNDNWLKNLLTGADESLGSINPVIKKINGDIESMGIKILSKGKAEPITKMATGKYSQVNATNAAAVIYSKKALNKAGIYDENFGSYLEDIDLSLRISRLGYRNLVSLKSEVTHIGQSTSKDLNWKKQYLDFKNWILVIIKNWSLMDLLLNLPAIFIERLRNLYGILKAL